MPLFDALRDALARRAPPDFFAPAFLVVFDFLGLADFLEAMVPVLLRSLSSVSRKSNIVCDKKQEL
jgi:hypothetical protein